MANLFTAQMLSQLDPQTRSLVSAIAQTPQQLPQTVSINRGLPPSNIEANRVSRQQELMDENRRRLMDVPQGTGAMGGWGALAGALRGIAAQRQGANDRRTLEEKERAFIQAQAREREQAQIASEQEYLRDRRDALADKLIERQGEIGKEERGEKAWRARQDYLRDNPAAMTPLQQAQLAKLQAEEAQPGFDAEQENKLRKEVSDATKEYAAVNDSFGRMQASYRDPSPAGDMAMVFNYMKILDPGSTVREGEYASAKNAASVPERVRTAYNNALDGSGLSPTQRDDFFNRAGMLYNEATKLYDARTEELKGVASQYNVRPEAIFRDRALYRDWREEFPESPPSESTAFQEGQIADNPQTGEAVIFRGGQWVPYE